MSPAAVVAVLLAHAAGLGTATVRAGDDGAVDVKVRLPAGAGAMRVEAPGCDATVSSAELSGAAVETRVHTRCAALKLEVGQHPLVTRWDGGEPRVLMPTAGWVQLPASARADPGPFTGWLREGVIHIASGVDHLLFLLGLCLLGARGRLVRQVTAFTLAHSLSLGLAAFGVVRLPSPPVEACIALSIAWVAWAAIRGRAEDARVVFAFGLLHGLGFATALDAAGLPVGAAVRALLGFNLGVEAGQLLVLLVLVPLVARLDRVRWPARTGLAWGLGAVGVAWTLERVVGFWGPQ